MLRFCLFTILLGVNFSASAGNIVTAVRVWPSADYTRITLEADQPLVNKLTVLKNPNRLVLDIDDVDSPTMLKALADKILASDPYIQQVRVSKFKPTTVRLVIDLKSEVKPNIFLLKPAGEYKHRLVLDIYPLPDALMAMLDSRDKQEVKSEPVANPTPKNKPELQASTTLNMQIIVEPLPANTEVNYNQEATLPQINAKPVDKAIAVKPAETKPLEPKIVESKIVEIKPVEIKHQEIKPIEVRPTEPTETATRNEPILKYKEGNRLITIAIDAGHGGEDPGAQGANGSHEKDITLAVAKKLKAVIDAEPNMRGVLTRDGDFFIPLHGRVVKARNMQADLFISIHADAFTNQAAKGSSVFALSERGATSATARYLAKKENESDLIGGVSLDNKDIYLARTLLDLSQTATINDSLKLGKAVLGNVGKINSLHKGSVEQAAFAVLKSPDIPSILVETAFISNPDEERKLLDEGYQTQLANSILAGVKKYFSGNPALAKTKIARE